MKKRTAHQTWLKYIVLVVLGCNRSTYIRQHIKVGSSELYQ